MMLKELIEAYTSRLKSYQFLLEKVEREMDQTKDAKFRQFCDCESKRLRDLIQLNKQVLGDLMLLARETEKEKALPAPVKKPKEV